MRRNLAFSFAFLLASASIPAQSTKPVDPQRLDLRTAAAASCPVGMSAKQQAGWDLVAAGGLQRGESASLQSIRLVLSSPGATLVSTRVRVHGLTAVAHADSVASRRSPLITRTLDLPLQPGANREAAADLVLRGFTSVRSIELLSVTYGDGGTWQPGEAACRVAPDPLMLAGTR